MRQETGEDATERHTDRTPILGNARLVLSLLMLALAIFALAGISLYLDNLVQTQGIGFTLAGKNVSYAIFPEIIAIILCCKSYFMLGYKKAATVATGATLIGCAAIFFMEFTAGWGNLFLNVVMKI